MPSCSVFEAILSRAYIWSLGSVARNLVSVRIVTPIECAKVRIQVNWRRTLVWYHLLSLSILKAGAATGDLVRGVPCAVNSTQLVVLIK